MLKTNRNFITRVLPAYAYGALVFLVCSVPMAPKASSPLWGDKVQHLLAFAVLGLLVVRALPVLRARVRSRHWAALVVSVLYGGVIELWQGLLPWRSMELLDWVADSAGAALAIGVHALVCRARASSQSGRE